MIHVGFNREAVFTGSPSPYFPSPRGVFKHLFSICSPYYLGAWNRLETKGKKELKEFPNCSILK